MHPPALTSAPRGTSLELPITLKSAPAPVASPTVAPTPSSPMLMEPVTPTPAAQLPPISTDHKPCGSDRLIGSPAAYEYRLLCFRSAWLASGSRCVQRPSRGS